MPANIYVSFTCHLVHCSTNKPKSYKWGATGRVCLESSAPLLPPLALPCRKPLAQHVGNSNLTACKCGLQVAQILPREFNWNCLFSSRRSCRIWILDDNPGHRGP